jgi:hypothetical protein
VYAGEHLVASPLELGGTSQVGQQVQGFPVDAVFAVVDVEVADGDGEFAAAVWVLGEEFTQVGAYDLVVVLASAFQAGVAITSGMCSTAVITILSLGQRSAAISIGVRSCAADSAMRVRGSPTSVFGFSEIIVVPR